MRMVNQALPRFASHLVAGQFREEGRGLGFSIGGWHPFRINTYLPTLKKLDPLANTALGKAVWKPIENLNASVNKDFAKVKVWSQDHRKVLQTAAALAAVAVGGYFAYGALTAGPTAEAATAAGAGGLSTTSTAVAATETLTPLAASSAAIPAGLLAPGVEAGVTFAGVAPTVVATGGGFLSTVGSVLASVAKSAAPLLALGKALSGGSQPQQVGMDPGAYGNSGYGTGFGPAFGGGGSLVSAPSGDTGTAQAPAGIPTWAWIAAAGLGIYLLTEGD